MAAVLMKSRRVAVFRSVIGDLLFVA